MDAKFKEWRERGIRCDRGNNFAMVFEAETAKGDGAPCTPGLQPVRLRDSFPSAIESTRVCTWESKCKSIYSAARESPPMTFLKQSKRDCLICSIAGSGTGTPGWRVGNVEIRVC
jgi:hypothetical protein